MVSLDNIRLITDETQSNVERSLDMLYAKQHIMMEHMGHDNSLEVFQEGFFKPINAQELDVFKFNNNHIVKSIKYFNEAFNSIPFDEVTAEFMKLKQEQETGKMDVINSYALTEKISRELINRTLKLLRDPTGSFEKGFKELSKQFNCQFKIYLTEAKGTGTLIRKMPLIPGKLSISKHKGFQLGGMLIEIQINIKQILSIVPANSNLFGQSLCGILLHEIYHNIAHHIDLRNKNLNDDIKSTITNVAPAKTFNAAKSSIKSFLSRFMKTFDVSKSDIKEDKATRRLYVLSQIKDNAGAMDKFENDIKQNADKLSDKEIDEYIKTLKRITSIMTLRKGAKIVGIAVMILLDALGYVAGATTAAVVGTCYLAIIALALLAKKVRSLFGLSIGIREEYYCDLFASMYKLPIHMSSYNRQIKLNKDHGEKITQVRLLEQTLSRFQKDVHPLTFEREVTSYHTAKQILASGTKLQPEIKQYLEYIVKLHDGIDDIKNPLNKKEQKKIDKEAAKDLKKTLRDFATKTGVAVTESYVDEFIMYGGDT